MSKQSNSTDEATRRPVKRGIRWTLMGATALTFIGLMAGGIAGLHHMANATAPVEAAPPVPVRAETVRAAPGYTVEERFVGRLEPARRTALAFERNGLVMEVLVEEGDVVTEGDPVARLDTDKLRAERAQLTARRQELESQLGLANLTLTRKKRLMDAGHDTVERHDQARFAVDGLVAAIASVDASLKALDVDISKAVLRAPFSGRVGARMIDEGAVASPNLPVIDLMEADRRQVRIGVSVEASAGMQVDRSYTLSAQGRSFSARLVAVRPDLSTSTRTVSALFDVEGADHLPFGEVMELSLERYEATPGFWVPLTALTEGRKGLWTVYALDRSDTDSTVYREAVEVLHAERTRAFVRGTISPGSMIVLDGTNRVVPGQRVALAQAER